MNDISSCTAKISEEDERKSKIISEIVDRLKVSPISTLEEILVFVKYYGR